MSKLYIDPFYKGILIKIVLIDLIMKNKVLLLIQFLFWSFYFKSRTKREIIYIVYNNFEKNKAHKPTT